MIPKIRIQVKFFQTKLPLKTILAKTLKKLIKSKSDNEIQHLIHTKFHYMFPNNS